MITQASPTQAPTAPRPQIPVSSKLPYSVSTQPVQPHPCTSIRRHHYLRWKYRQTTAIQRVLRTATRQPPAATILPKPDNTRTHRLHNHHTSQRRAALGVTAIFLVFLLLTTSVIFTQRCTTGRLCQGPQNNFFRQVQITFFLCSGPTTNHGKQASKTWSTGLGSNMAGLEGVLVDHVRHDPYMSPDIKVNAIDPSGFMSSNIIDIESVAWRFSDNNKGDSRLGIPDTRTMTVSVTLRLGNMINGRRNFANNERPTISLTHRDDDNYMDRVNIFTHDPLTFPALVRRAIMGLPGPFLGLPVNDVLQQITTVVNNAGNRTSFHTARDTLERALNMIHRVISPGLTLISPAGDLYGVWRDYVEDIRRPRMETADDLLARADRSVEIMASDLISHGANMNDIRVVGYTCCIMRHITTNHMQILSVVYRRIFLLRLIVKCYLEGAWE